MEPDFDERVGAASDQPELWNLPVLSILLGGGPKGVMSEPPLSEPVRGVTGFPGPTR